MRKLPIQSILFIMLWLAACDNHATLDNKQANKKQLDSTVVSEKVDDDFNDFIVKFSIDTAFQISRTKFPLKLLGTILIATP